MQTMEERTKMLDALRLAQKSIDDLLDYEELKEFFSKDQHYELWRAWCNIGLALDLIPEDPADDPIEDEEA